MGSDDIKAQVAMQTDTERQVEIPWLVDRIFSPNSILDIGGADAMYHKWMVAAAVEVHCIDTRRAKPWPGVTYHVGSVTDMPASWTERFDLVTSISSLDHVGLVAYGNESIPGALQAARDEIYRVCKTSGRFILTAPTGRDMTTTHGSSGGQRVFSTEALRVLFPAHLWEWIDIAYWRLVGENYIPCAQPDIVDVGYAGHRAAAVVAIEMVKMV